MLIKCVGRRRIVVEPSGDKVILHIWFRDPPSGRRVASLEIEKDELNKLLLSLVDAVSTRA